MNTEQQTRQTARDFLIAGLQNGHIGERELAQWIIEGLTYDTDAVKRLIGEISEEQADYELDMHDELETGDLHKELIKLNNASDITHIMINEFNNE